mmetsp:Transcript_39219/g.39702  ORF Transcript_39219/g.39702 Transcript_39219/m.39702 type:complete len:116 (+) Transcript_39219:570-917(+)
MVGAASLMRQLVILAEIHSHVGQQDLNVQDPSDEMGPNQTDRSVHSAQFTNQCNDKGPKGKQGQNFGIPLNLRGLKLPIGTNIRPTALRLLLENDLIGRDQMNDTLNVKIKPGES